MALLTGVLLAARWWTSPDLFPDSGAGMAPDPRPVAQAALVVGATAPFSDDRAEPTEIVFTGGATTDLRGNSAEATAEVAVCRAAPGTDPIGAVWEAELDTFCNGLEPLREGVRMTQGHWEAERRDYVVVILRPTRPGTVRLAGVSLDYRSDRSQLYRRGTDSIALDVTLTAR